MNESDIDRLLRLQAPEIPVRPGLEARIHAALRQRHRHLSPAWLALPATAVVALVVVLSPQEKPVPKEVFVSVPAPADEGALDLELNPLGSEAEAIRNDAERTGRFLINCLPSLSVAER
ncbi:hypothetical protein [Haloferula sp. A504]|uniref:hypothetical protein n=1 Tax=Haloferula sp. A504 TaxID=3373601 RepID=UPI0031CBF7FA|nr:hypothetical protein [Verrucomicrobiaceae bacterium E54]